MMSPKSVMCYYMNKPKIFVKKSSTNVGVGRLGVPYCVGSIIVAMCACGIC